MGLEGQGEREVRISGNFHPNFTQLKFELYLSLKHLVVDETTEKLQFQIWINFVFYSTQGNSCLSPSDTKLHSHKQYHFTCNRISHPKEKIIKIIKIFQEEEVLFVISLWLHWTAPQVIVHILAKELPISNGDWWCSRKTHVIKTQRTWKVWTSLSFIESY